MDDLENLKFTISADTEPFRKKLNEARKLTAQTRKDFTETSRIAVNFGSRITSILKSAVIDGRRLDDTLRRVALSLSDRVFSQAFKPLETAIDRGLSSLFSNAFGFAKGGIVGQGRVIPFARGGVISSPVAFPMGGNRVGFAGEAGAEAILPLARGPDGRLGVQSDRTSPSVIINFNVSTQDAESFRRSESQFSAMLNRAVSRGTRNL